MENKHIVIGGAVILVIVLGILAVFQNTKSPDIGGGFGFMDLNKSANTSPQASPSPAITQLQGQDLKVGTGSAVMAGDVITVHYVGMFLDGKKFDSSYDRNQPFTVQVGANQVIPGFEQGVVGMKVGGKRRLIIPSSLAYGEKGQGPIGPNTPIAFDIELIAIKPKEEMPAPEANPEVSVTPAESPIPSVAPTSNP